MRKKQNVFILHFHLVGDEKFAVFLSKDGQLLDKQVVSKKKGESEILLEVVTKLLKKNKLVMSEMAALAVVQGVGSFTSTRIALATVNAIGYVLHKPLITIDAAKIIKQSSGLFDFSYLSKQAYKNFIKKKLSWQLVPKYSGKPNITLKK